MNRVSLLKYLVKSSSTTCSRSTYATFSNKKFLNEKKSVTVKRNQLFNGFEAEFLQFIKTTKDLTSIHQFKKDVILKYNSELLTETSFDAVFMRMCVACRNYPIGKQFLDNLTKSGCQVNTATLARYLELCYHCREEIKDTSEVERLCHVVKSNSQYLNPNIQQSLILGFSITDNWREGYKLLSEGEGTSTSLSMNAIIDCFFKNDQIDSAVSWINKIISSNGKKVYDFTYEHWLRKCKYQQIGCNSFLDFLVKSGVFLNTSTIQQLKDLLESQPINPFVGHFTTIDEDTGRCRSCKNLLQNPEISDDEFADLKKGLMEKVLLGTDVYLGSKPEEIRRFQNFIQKTAPYDVVIDGLNVAYQGKQTFKYPEALTSVVKYFTNQNLRVLVLTRKHLLRRTALQSALVFSTEDLSGDDPFLLCSAVQSSHTKFVSEDVFRDHLFRLGDFRLQNIFRRWQHKAQMQIVSFGKNGKVKFQPPRNYRTISQFADGCWHIPYDDGTPRYSYELPTTWLCLQPKTSNITNK